MYDEDHFKGLTAEALVPDHNRQGYLIYAWKKVNQTRNEQLDTRVYARAAAAVVGMDRWSDKTWDEVSGNYNKKTKPDGQQKKKSSSFWQNH
jgi:phage terminase large subunit GpA-like protein